MNAINLAVLKVELFKSLENVFNRMLELTAAILGILFFVQDKSKRVRISLNQLVQIQSYNFPIYIPLVIMAPSNCVVRSAATFTLRKLLTRSLTDL